MGNILPGVPFVTLVDAAGQPLYPATYNRGYIDGFVTANAADAVNDITVQPGLCRDDSGQYNIILSQAITKQLDGAWAAGNNQGGRDTGAIADATWHLWAIGNPLTGESDILLSQSASAPTLPVGFTIKRLVWSAIRAGGTILAYRQVGDVCKLATPAVDTNDVAAAADALVALTVPAGLRVRPILNIKHLQGAAGDTNTSVGDGDAPAVQIIAARTVGLSEIQYVTFEGLVTNTARQIRRSVTVTSGSLGQSVIATMGWVHPRGRDA